MLHRRFIRLKALQNLYAFHIAQQANYANALDQLQAAFQPNPLDSDPATPAEQALAQAQALDLLQATLSGTQSTVTASLDVRQAVAQAHTSYQAAQTKDWGRLQKGLDQAASAMDQAWIRMIQLLVTWANYAQKQAERSKLHPSFTSTPTAVWYQHAVIQHLQADKAWAQYVHQHDAGWQQHAHVAAEWYQKFVKENSQVQQCLTAAAHSSQATALWECLIKGIILKEGEIKTFFSELDINWAVHQHIVKRNTKKAWLALEAHSQKDINLDELSVTADWEKARKFYIDLVTTTWTRGQELEALMVEQTENWTADRLVLIDKIILKLALCEMKYFHDIPIKVSINEYIELSKTYSTPKSSQFVNGLLDAAATTLQ